MVLRRLAIQLESTAAPSAVWSLLSAAERAIDHFEEVHWRQPVPGFHPSDFRLAYHALLWMRREFASGDVLFCEWGSGFGVVAALAGLLGFRAYGIEADANLIAAARQLADRLDLPVQFFQGSFLPDAARHRLRLGESLAWLDTETGGVFEEIGFDPHDFEIIYAYPWPGEERVIFDLFDDYAAAGAWLLTYHGAEDLRLHQKVSSRRRHGRRRG